MKTLFIDIRTSDLKGKPLDWAVALADCTFKLTIGDTDGLLYMPPCVLWQPSTDWAQGGPKLQLHSITWDGQAATICKFVNGKYPKWTEYGSTQLVAGMRCLVASIIGPVVNVPSCLLS